MFAELAQAVVDLTADLVACFTNAATGLFRPARTPGASVARLGGRVLLIASLAAAVTAIARVSAPSWLWAVAAICLAMAGLLGAAASALNEGVEGRRRPVDRAATLRQRIRQRYRGRR